MTYEQLGTLARRLLVHRAAPAPDRPGPSNVYRGVRTGDRPAPGSSPRRLRHHQLRETIAADHPDFVPERRDQGTAPDASPAAAELAALVDELDLADHASS